MKIAIRDDDTSYYTRPEQLESAFIGLDNIPISLSVVPFAVKEHMGLNIYGEIDNHNKYSDIELNKELVDYIKKGIKQGRFEVIQHGINHEYRKESNGLWRAETEYLKKEELKRKIEVSKAHLEKIFEVKLNIFAAPSNAVSTICSEVLDDLGINVNCVVGRLMKRKISLYYILNYLKSNLFKLVTGQRYGGVLKYSNHKELNINDFKDFDTTWKLYNECKKYQFPMIIYTHYWDLNSDINKKEELKKFIKMATEDGAETVFVSDCFK